MDDSKENKSKHFEGYRTFDEFMGAYGSLFASGHDKFLGSFTEEDEALSAWAAYQQGRQVSPDRRFVCIGRYGDFFSFKKFPHYSFLKVNLWTETVNKMFVQGAIDSRSVVHLATPVTRKIFGRSCDPLFKSGDNTEYNQLSEAGYIRCGDFMIPPPRLGDRSSIERHEVLMKRHRNMLGTYSFTEDDQEAY